MTRGSSIGSTDVVNKQSLSFAYCFGDPDACGESGVQLSAGAEMKACGD